eukprot:6107244-Pyramimonas_sp.AAC.1
MRRWASPDPPRGPHVALSVGGHNLGGRVGAHVGDATAGRHSAQPAQRPPAVCRRGGAGVAISPAPPQQLPPPRNNQLCGFDRKHLACLSTNGARWPMHLSQTLV